MLYVKGVFALGIVLDKQRLTSCLTSLDLTKLVNDFNSK